MPLGYLPLLPAPRGLAGRQPPVLAQVDAGSQWIPVAPPSHPSTPPTPVPPDLQKFPSAGCCHNRPSMTWCKGRQVADEDKKGPLKSEHPQTCWPSQMLLLSLGHCLVWPSPDSWAGGTARGCEWENCRVGAQMLRLMGLDFYRLGRPGAGALEPEEPAHKNLPT